jgi:hypothetical protein
VLRWAARSAGFGGAARDQVRSSGDLERPLVTVVEQLIDFVTDDHH